jgi:uncharacterized damage-inducible protein DinB
MRELRPEPWLRGPVEGVPPLLMPAAHALLQAREDAAGVLASLTTGQLWARPGGAASAGFHLRHLAGALDRLLTYARGLGLDEAQRRAASAEERETGLDAATLAADVNRAIEAALAQIRATRESDLLEPRGVGRRQLPSTVIGLVFHAAEHATRHAGQAVTTARIVRSGGVVGGQISGGSR